MLCIRKPWILVACLLFSHCKTPRSDLDGELFDRSAEDTESFDPGITLEQFDYQLDLTAIKELGARIGCEKTSRWMSFPKSATLIDSARKVMDSAEVYETVKDEFFNRKVVFDACRTNGEPVRKANDHGVKRLLQFVKSQNANGGVTLIMAGGFGSHLGDDPSLDESIESWDSLRDELEDDSFAAWQIECTNSFAPNERCAAELLARIAEREALAPRTTNHQYLLWGYSKGGNTILEALRQSKDLRNKTLAVVTNGSPLGGSTTMTMVYPAFEKFAASVGEASGQLGEFVAAQPWAYLMTPGAYLLDGEMLAVRIAKLMTEEESAQIAAGAAGMKPAARKRYLYNDIKNADFSRDDGRTIPVFHSSAVVDLATMEPWPLLTVEDGKLSFSRKSFATDHLAEFGFTPVMRDFPLNDTCVALEHSVIPRDALPAGLSSELIALFAFDHSAHRLTPMLSDAWGVPHIEIVDALLETIAIKLEGGQ